MARIVILHALLLRLLVLPYALPPQFVISGRARLWERGVLSHLHVQFVCTGHGSPGSAAPLSTPAGRESDTARWRKRSSALNNSRRKRDKQLAA
ncbi:hypothetical protein EVAR_19237_1 [Eumeta japonica]|uniref:Secreted protein n=1 Tax=Eumeta variegata TaxID=151549 RepID=A0A4C1VD95_EUMVA|nr:hypothetical protein EVAR_19237_1 [Eumeta japonica]